MANYVKINKFLNHQTAVASKTWLLFLIGERAASPINKLAKKLPAKMTDMEETQQLKGCFRLKEIPPVMKRWEYL